MIAENVSSYLEKQEGLIKKAAKNRVPLCLDIELLARCNFHCKMCYVRMDEKQAASVGRERSAEEWIDMLRQAVDCGCYHLTITGGEPLLRPDFPLLYEAIAQMGLVILLFSNLSLVTDLHIELFKKYPPNEIRFTLYGASPDTYGKVCGNRDGFEKSISNLKKLLKAIPNTPIISRATLVKENLGDEEAMREMMKELGVPFSAELATMKPIRGAKAEGRVTYEEWQEYYRLKSKKKGGEQRAEKEEAGEEDGKMHCNAAACASFISFDGKMLPCTVFSKPYVLPFEIGFRKAWEELVKLRDQIRVPKRCFHCSRRKYCGNCAAMIQAESGTYEEENAVCDLCLAKSIT